MVVMCLEGSPQRIPICLSFISPSGQQELLNVSICVAHEQSKQDKQKVQLLPIIAKIEYEKWYAGVFVRGFVYN